MRMDSLDAARAIVAERYDGCDVALLAGSVVRGQATATSDLDIVIVDARLAVPYRESFVAHGWPVEAFVNTPESYRRFFASDAERRTPSLPAMCAEGVVLRDRDGLAERIKMEARDWLARGPAPLSAREIRDARYALTDRLDDFIGATRRDEGMFAAHALATLAAEFVLAAHRAWSGRGKWLIRALRRFDPETAERLATALEAYYRGERKDELIAFVDDALAPFGGRLFVGYSTGKDEEKGEEQGEEAVGEQP
jgi:predicted nucleotidyltransferase